MPLSQAGLVKARYAGPCPGVFEDMPRGRVHSLSGQPVPALCHMHITEVLPGVQRAPPVLCFVPIASCPVTRHP